MARVIYARKDGPRAGQSVGSQWDCAKFKFVCNLPRGQGGTERLELISCAKPTLPWHLLIWCGGDSTRSLRLPPTWGWCHQPSHEPSASSFPSPSLLQPTGCLAPGTVASYTCGPGFLPHAVPSTCSHGLVGTGSAWGLWQNRCDTPKAQSFIITDASMFSAVVSSWDCFGDGNFGAHCCFWEVETEPQQWPLHAA